MTQTYVPKFTYIIPFRFSPDRIINLRRAVDLISSFHSIELMVVEQDTTSKIDHLNLRCTHIFCESEYPFNKSWAFNVGLKRSLSDVIIFADADFLIAPDNLIESLKALDKFDCVIPTSNVVKLNPNESLMDIHSIFQISRIDDKKNMVDGISIFRKEAIYKIGGWNEDIFGVEYDNKFQDMKIKKSISYTQMNFTGYHLYHNPMGDFPNRELIEDKNKKILEYFDQNVQDLHKHIDRTLPLIGMQSKYSN